MSNVISMNRQSNKPVPHEEFLEELKQHGDCRISAFIGVDKDGVPFVHANNVMLPELNMLLDIVKDGVLGGGFEPDQ